MRRIALLLLSGLVSTGLSVPGAEAQSPPKPRAAMASLYADLVAEAAHRFGIPADWIWAVLRAESAGDPRAVSSKGAIGLMQIMPGTWTALRTRYGLGSDPYDPRDNILAGAAYLRELHDRYGSISAMLAAYNAGPGRYEDSLRGRPLPPETRAYVAAVAPILDGASAAAPVMVAAVDPLDWTRAPLFVVQSDRASAADPVSVEHPSHDAASTQSVRDVSAIVPQSAGLFVTSKSP
ncbi:lytic transglycosylase domain-containing protein [Oceanicella sp. SM1341]|uniref:lytic transglycosylase domain-containing protein n=1 Tax=Oceanicella sp. SM1341 TaxID=1548889 RepID=UPI000E467232|nr:lytic transglycosylase domain-containing protein [Oceanicella sp. SM1341]